MSRKGEENCVGIFMPTFNVGQYIEEAVDSILAQTYMNWRLVIVNDGSDVENKGIINSIQDRKDFIDLDVRRGFRIFHMEHHSGKIGYLKNYAIKKLDEFNEEKNLNMEYICHVGSDDIIPPDCLKIFVDYMDKNPKTGACCGNFLCFNDVGEQWTMSHVADSGDYDSNTLLQYNNGFPMRFYRRKAVKDVGGYSNDLSSGVDYDLMLKLDELKLKGEIDIHRIKDPITYFYRQHSQQVSRRARPQQDLNAKKALEDALFRRKIDGVVKNDTPPFVIEYNTEKHFIWGG